jgi:AraC-like DNA-binding protein
VRRATILAATTNHLLRRAVREGLDERRLLVTAGIDTALLRDDLARIPRDADTALWHAIERALADDTFGLRFAQDLTAEAFGPVGFYAMSGGTIGEALARSVRYHHVVKDDVDVRATLVERALHVEQILPPDQAPWSRPIGDYAIASYVSLARRWTGVRITPREVRFRHGAPRDRGAYERFFGCPVWFDQPATAIVLDRETLEIPLSTAQPEFDRYLERLVREAVSPLERRDLVADARAAIKEALLHDRTVSLPVVARRVGASSRTLQRRLESAGLTFQSAVDEVRRAIALPLLTATDLSVEEIGERLGYSDVAAFRRAFRRWTGVPPAVVRRGEADAILTDRPRSS